MRSVPPQRSDCWDLFRNPHANLSHINSKATSTFELPKRQQCNRNLELMAEIKDLYAQLDRMREIRLARTGMIADAIHATSLRRLCSCQSYPVLSHNPPGMPASSCTGRRRMGESRAPEEGILTPRPSSQIESDLRTAASSPSPNTIS